MENVSVIMEWKKVLANASNVKVNLAYNALILVQLKSAASVQIILFYLTENAKNVKFSDARNVSLWINVRNVLILLA